MTYTIQVALDGVNFVDAVTVKLTVDNEEIQNEYEFARTTEADIKNVIVKHVDENGNKVADDDIYKGYAISMVYGLGIAPKEISGYELVGMKEEIDLDNDFVNEGRTYTYVYRQSSGEPEMPEGPEKPKAPESAKAILSGGHNDVEFSWSESEGADGYLVSYKKATSKTWSKTKTVKGTSYKKKDLSANVTYEFKVTPYVLADGKKLYDETQSVVVTVDTKKNVKAPSSVKAVLSGGHNNVKVSWSKAKNASGYFVYAKAEDEEVYTELGSTAKRTYTVKNLKEGVKYTFKVVPYYKKNDEKVESYYSKTKTVYTLKKLDAPIVEKYSSKKVKVKWENISGETGYQISRSATAGGKGIVSTYSTTSGKSKTLTVTKGKPYYYKVRVYKTVNGKKVYGPWSDETEFTL